MTTATAAKVVLDREAVYDLLVEIHAVNDLYGWVGGVSPAAMEELGRMAEQIAITMLGDTEEDETGFIGAHPELWDAGQRRAYEILDDLVGKRSGDAN